MDLVASSSCLSHDLLYLDAHSFAHLTARALCIYDAKGPREMIWRHDQGLECFTTDPETNILILSCKLSETLEMIKADVSTPIPNPCKSAIIHLALSRESEKLYGLSGMVDHRLVIWSLDKTPQVLISQKLDIICQKLTVNPVDSNLSCIYGADGLRLVTFYEVFGQRSLQVEAVRRPTELFNTEIRTALWLPLNRVLAVLSSGELFVVYVETKEAVSLGKCADPVLRKDNVLPTCATLTVNHLIIGTEDGIVYWYPLNNLLQDTPNSEGNFFDCPVQAMRLNKKVCSLSIDPSRSQLLANTENGQIFKVLVDVEQSPENERAEEEQEQVKQDYRGVEGEPVGNEVSGGIVLCSRYASIGVRKFSSKAKTSLTCLLLGTHCGQLKIWRNAVGGGEPFAPGLQGLRRCVPRASKELLSLRTKSEAAISAIEIVQWKAHSQLIYIGNTAGIVEIWKVEAIENDDEDAREIVQENVSKLAEDDEGSCLARLEMSFQLQTKVFRSAISSLAVLAYSGIDAETRVAVASADEEKIFILSAFRDNQLSISQVLNVLDLAPCMPSCISVADECLVAFHNDGGASHYPASLPCSIIDHAFALRSCGTVALAAISSSARIAVLVNTAGMAYYLRLDGQKISTRSSFSSLRPLEHADLVCSLSMAPNGETCATGSIGGLVTMWKIDGEGLDVVQINQIYLHSAAISSLAFSPSSSTLFTSSVDGSCFVCSLGKLPTKASKPVLSSSSAHPKAEPAQYLLSDMPQDSNDLVLKDHMEREQEKELRAAHKFKCMGISAAIQEIQHRLNLLVQQNFERTELEQLSLEDFVIDLDMKDTIEVRNKDSARQLREKYFLRKKWLELLAARLKNMTWDNAAESSVLLKPFLGIIDVDPIESEGVSSFSISKPTAREETTLEKLKKLRALEIRTMKKSSETGNIRHIRGSAFFRCAWALATKGCAPEVSWIVNEGGAWPLQQRFDEMFLAMSGANNNTNTTASAAKGNEDNSANKREAGEEDEDASILSLDDDYDVEEGELLNLLYAPETVRTIVQKRNQILMLKEIVRKIKERFNKVFTQLQREKEDCVQFISTRNERITAILEELHLTDKIWAPTWCNQEKRGSAIEVAEEEMISQPYESEEVRQQRLKEAEERALRQQSDEQSLERERALLDMMHGTLEVKRDVFAEALLLQRPPWMDTLTPSEMNDAQLKEYEAYQNKLRELQEEQAHYRKTLEQEMKKLKVEITECCKAFNDKLEVLGKLKILAHKEVLAQEIYIVRISSSMVKAEQLRSTCKRNDNRLQELRKERLEIKARNEKIARSFEELKARISAVQEEEKSMDKTFRRDLQNLCNNTFDQDSLKIFTMLYRKRIYPRGALISSMDNFGEQSEIDNSASASRYRRSGKDASTSRRHKGNSSRRGDLLGGTKNATKNRFRSSRNVSASAMGPGKDSTAANLGPMQQAAQALLNPVEADNNSALKEKDPYNEAILDKQKLKKQTEAQIPLLNPLLMDMDCPEGFVVDQFSWSKLQELRNARIEKEIEAKLLAIEQSEVRSKIIQLEQEETSLNNQFNDTRQLRDSTVSQLQNVETNLDIMVSLLQGQDEVDYDAVATDYTNALLFPVDVVSKYNARIKELGGEKISILAKTKIFRRKINLISWEARHQALQAKHFEAYYTDLQLFRVTRDLQKVILEGENANNQKVCEINIVLEMDILFYCKFPYRNVWKKLVIAKSSFSKTTK
jgi:WD40 repeat protein